MDTSQLLAPEILVESRTARDGQLATVQSDEQAIDILSKAKALYQAMWANGCEFATIEQLAEYYEVSEDSIHKIWQRQTKAELRSDGCKLLQGKELKYVLDKLSKSEKAPPSLIGFTPRGAVRVGFLLTNSKVAAQVRTIALNLIETVVPGPPPTSPPVFTSEDQLHLVERGLSLLERLGPVDSRTKLQFADHVRDIVLNDGQTPRLPSGERSEWPISERCTFLGYKPDRLQLQRIGKEMARLYQERHGEKPPKRDQYVDGAVRQVNSYGQADVDLIDEAIASVMGVWNEAN